MRSLETAVAAPDPGFGTESFAEADDGLLVWEDTPAGPVRSRAPAPASAAAASLPASASAPAGFAAASSAALRRPVAVDVWLTDTERIDPRRLAAYVARLNPAEALRYHRFLVHEARLQFAVARALSREVLSRYVPVEMQDWVFAIDDKGKPRIDEPALARHLQFNLSHTQGLVACAVAVGREVGVDVEDGRRDFSTLAGEPTIYSPVECGAAAALPPDQRGVHWLSLWTLKEAYAKARGVGLSAPIHTLSFQPGQPWCELQCPPGWDDPAEWRFHLSQPTHWHRLAVAVPAPPGSAVRVDVRWLTPRLG